MIYLTILNTALIAYIYLLRSDYFFRLENNRSNKGTYIGTSFSLWTGDRKTSSGLYKMLINIRFRNYKKITLQEDADRLMRQSEHNKRYSLNAIFSWYKTQEEVDLFNKYYRKVNPELVDELVSKFYNQTLNT